jgi:hypothetical protein
VNALRPFFMLLNRAAVIWVSIIGLATALLILAGMKGSDGSLGIRFDIHFIAAFMIPACAGWLAGAVVQEFQYTTFAMVLPRASQRIAGGFLAAGLVVTLLVMSVIGTPDSTLQNPPLLFIIGLAAYCLGGTFIDQSGWNMILNTLVVLMVIVRSVEVATIASGYPWLAAATAVTVIVASTVQRFSRSTSRRKPFLATGHHLPGRFYLERARQYRRRQMLRLGPSRSLWRPQYFGNHVGRWVRAAIHESRGAHTVKTVTLAISRAWALVLLILLYAWADKGEFSYGQALAMSINAALISAPHIPVFGEHGGPFQMVTIVIAMLGFAIAVFSPAALNSAIFRPLSRQQQARVQFGGGLVDVALLLFILSPSLLAIGHYTGWLAGFEVRFDFMPYFFRVLLITLVLMPVAHRWRLQLEAATRKKADYTTIMVILAITGYSFAVSFLTFLSPRITGSFVVELATLVIALLVSQLIYRRWLLKYYRVADLA